MEKISCGGFYLGDGLNVEKDEFGRPVLNASGGGLPDASEMPDGTMMVAVNGEWKEQSGYGYEISAAIEPIIIKPEDEPTITAIMSSTDPDEDDDVLYCAKQGNFSKNDFIGGKYILSTEEAQVETLIDSGNFEDGNYVQSLEGIFFIIQDFPATFDNDRYTISGGEPGVYYSKKVFNFGYKSLSLVPPTIVQTIDQKFIPNKETIVEFSMDETTGGIVANKSVIEVFKAMLSSVVVGTIDMGDGHARPLGPALMDANLKPAFALTISEGTSQYMIDVVDWNWRLND